MERHQSDVIGVRLTVPCQIRKSDPKSRDTQVLHELVEFDHGNPALGQAGAVFNSAGLSEIAISRSILKHLTKENFVTFGTRRANSA